MLKKDNCFRLSSGIQDHIFFFSQIYNELADVMGDRPCTTPLTTISSINVPDTYDNNFDISDADDEGTMKANSKMLAITDTSSSVKKSSQTKRNAESILYLK